VQKTDAGEGSLKQNAWPKESGNNMGVSIPVRRPDQHDNLLVLATCRTSTREGFYGRAFPGSSAKNQLLVECKHYI